MLKIVLATGNKGKIAEFSQLMKDFDVEVISMSEAGDIPEIVEDGETFEENALKKARIVSEATGLIAVSDDSGLAVDALEGAPGVFSARFSERPGKPATDERNNEKLLYELDGVSKENRTARFVCVIAAYAPNGETLLARGVWEGRIATELKGDNGFGYDPLFIDPGSRKHSAEMTPEEKNARSHRGHALRLLRAEWEEFLEKASKDK